MSELDISVVIMRENMLISGEIYTTGKNFTLPPGLTGWTNFTSESRRDFSNPLIYLPFPPFSHKNPSKKVACHLMISNSQYPLPRCSFHLILNLYLRAC